jgi:hypothetical protein
MRPDRLSCALLLLACVPAAARADAVLDWNRVTGDALATASRPAPESVRILALAQTAVYEAVHAATRGDAAGAGEPQARPGASIDAAVAEATRAVLAQLLPEQRGAVEAEFARCLSAVPAGSGREAGLAAGRDAAALVLARRAQDTDAGAEPWRPETAPGRYVPTATPIATSWPARTPWVLARADELRPAPPPSLDSERWARDYAEIRALGAREGSRRTPEQTEIARFWEATQPPIYLAVVHCVAAAPDRDVTRSARLLAAVAQAMDDALIAVFDAKYHYAFWRPVTAIRNGDRDGNDATERDAGWLPFLETPMHPEYPAAHCGLAGAVAAVLAAEVGDGPLPVLRSRSPTLPGVERTWTTLDAFVQEVAEARICDGVHYRTSTEVGTAIGRAAGARVAAKFGLGRASVARR